ncbi:MAG TPA: hypothetical protein VN132_14960 [Bdellovibrio sp.]|nr:hypothetical protein [Bdellovibrio sp.]
MTPQKLDFIFPFVVFFYGLFMVFVLENPYLARLGQTRMAEAYAQLSRHKNFGWMCFFVGGLWVAQNIWYSTL